MTTRWRRHPVLAGVAGLALLAGAAAVAPVVGRATPLSYVALGDSYTAAPLVAPLAPGSPPDCLRSAHNYPHLTAAARGYSLTDRSCSSATTANLSTPQSLDQPAQFRALKPGTGLVTLGIGGNDNQLFLGAIAACSATDILDIGNVGAPCRTVFGSYFANLANGDGPDIGRALATIHRLAPAAKVFVIGYPAILPQQGNCYPELPLTTADVAYLDGVERALNATLQREAAAHDATYVDTYTPSLGHDACQPEGSRWVEPLLPGTVAMPIHPNALGEVADARDLRAALDAAGL